MKVAAKEMEFERAADLRDEIQTLEKVLEGTKSSS
jgi:excinuclease UvrABC nuclease subunit